MPARARVNPIAVSVLAFGYPGHVAKQPSPRDAAAALAAVLSPIVGIVALVFAGAGIFDYLQHRAERGYTRAECTMLAKPPRESSGSKRPTSVTRHYPVSVTTATEAIETEATVNIDGSVLSGARDYEGAGSEGALPVGSSLPRRVTCFYDADAPRQVVFNRARSFSVVPLSGSALVLLLAILGIRRFLR
jgi:hypothetical protein